MQVDKRRVRQLNDKPTTTGTVVYWMQRDQRVQDNWALLYAQEKAFEHKMPLYVVFNMVSNYGDAPLRAYEFMIEGLKKVEAELRTAIIGFSVLIGEPEETVSDFVNSVAAGELVVDFNPLRLPTKWQQMVAERVGCRMTQVDAHNIVPCWVASDKEEFAAHTFRPKVTNLLKEFLTDHPPLQDHPYKPHSLAPVDWETVIASLKVDRTITAVDWITPGTQAAKIQTQTFIKERLAVYHTDRNDPNADALSNLSPYLHFGQLSAQWVAKEINELTGIPRDAKQAYLEELIVRRELTDNYCFYNDKYDKVAGAHAWAQKTIKEHKDDEREYIYTKEEFETGKTHDELWNAMQWQMVTEGKMHGWCRMYWAKKILEWTPDTQTAIDIALYLNDKYELDGRDPNGVAGVMWSICGVHDRAWTERPVFGKIRYMNFSGAKRKFDVKAYIEKYSNKETLFDDQ